MSADVIHYSALSETKRDVLRAVAKLQKKNDDLPSGEEVASRINNECPDGPSESQVYRVISELENQGLVFKQDSDTDRRAYDAGITDQGARTLDQLIVEYSELVPLSAIGTCEIGRNQSTTSRLARSDGEGWE